MTASVAVGIVAALATRGAIAWRDARRRNAEPLDLEARIARAVARAEAEVLAQDTASRRAA